MIFRPSFCANCGEKIERKEWHLWTSRRFCPVCESEFKGQDLIPRAIVGIGVLATVVGFTGYCRTISGGSDVLVSRQPRSVAELPVSKASTNSIPVGSTAAKDSTSTTPVNRASNTIESPNRTPPTLPAPKRNAAGVESGEAAYYCGAQTKKGTPCTRRVKGNIRCFQHPGMPAMLSADKLRIG